MVKVIVAALAVAFFAVAARGAAVPPELAEAAKAARTACIEETGATEEMIEKAGGGDFADDEKLKCYIKCTLDKFQLIDGDNINIDAMLKLVPPSMKDATQTIEACRETSGADICEKSYNFSKCLYKVKPEDFFVV